MFKPALAVGVLFAHDGADFRRADFKADNDVGIVKHFFSDWLQVWIFFASSPANRWPPSSGREHCWPPPGPGSQCLTLVLSFQIINPAPARQLLLQIIQSESDFAALPRRRHDYPRRRDIHAPQIHQPRHRRMVERPDQLQRRLHLRRFHAMPRLQFIILQPRDHGQLRAHLRQRNHAQTRIQRLHHKAVQSQLKHGKRDSARTASVVGTFTCATGIAFLHPDLQRARQHALDGDRIDRRNRVRGCVSPMPGRARSGLRPASRSSSGAIVPARSRHPSAPRCSGWRMWNFHKRTCPTPIRPCATTDKARNRAERHAQRDGRQPRARRPHLVGAQLHVEHMPAIQPPVFWFTLKPHKKFTHLVAASR